MHTAKGTTSKALQFNNNGVVVGDQSFRLSYYTTASVPFIWESQPGTPKHPLTESSLPPLTPPPSYNLRTQNYNDSSTQLRQLIQLNNSHQYHHRRCSKRSGFFRGIFRDGCFGCSRRGNGDLSSECSSGSPSAGLMEVRRVEEEEGGSPAAMCFGGGFKRSYRWFVRRCKD